VAPQSIRCRAAALGCENDCIEAWHKICAWGVQPELAPKEQLDDGAIPDSYAKDEAICALDG
jgi:hypothetical protein